MMLIGFYTSLFENFTITSSFGIHLFLLFLDVQQCSTILVEMLYLLYYILILYKLQNLCLVVCAVCRKLTDISLNINWPVPLQLLLVVRAS